MQLHILRGIISQISRVGVCVRWICIEGTVWYNLVARC